MNRSELETMRRTFQILDERRKRLLEDERIIKLKDRVKKIREDCVSNIEDLITSAKTSLAENGIRVSFAKDSRKALKEIHKIVKDETIVAKSKSNTIAEIGLSEFLENKGIKILETDLGDRIIQLDPKRREPSHPTGPTSHLNVHEIAKIASGRFGVRVEPKADIILNLLKNDIIEKLSDCRIGITGANAIAAEEGSIILVHNEGNINLVSMQEIHIAVVGIDKVVRTIEDGISVAKMETVYANGTMAPSYINVISGPSKTADIEKMLIKDMYGAKEVVVVLLDNGRSNAPGECLWCIGCGSCVLSCPIYNVVGHDFGYRGYLGGRGVVISRFIENKKVCFDSGLFLCTLCGLCTLDCPVEIPTSDMIEKLRTELVDSGLFFRKHKEIAEKIKKRGSPF